MKFSQNLKRLLSVWVVVLHVLITTMSVIGIAHAQTGNADGTPLIELERVESGIAGDDQIFTATVSDDGDLLNVVFFYRLDRFETFTEVPMSAIPGTSIYTVTIELLTRELGVIEYYINARDAEGNTAIAGFAFDPLKRVLVASESAVTSADATQTPTTTVQQPPSTPSTSGLSTGRKIVYGALAILAVGALAAAAGSGGSGDDSTTAPGGGPTIPVIITVDTVSSGF